MKKKYILITSARNEETLIEGTIISVIKQSLKPTQWIIVNDNSTDSTEEIIKKYLSEYSFIKLINKKDREERNFASKVYLKGIRIWAVRAENFMI